jgi:hypothetical protein
MGTATPGLAFNRATGQLWEHEHWPQGGDELNPIVRGGNYGWPIATYGIGYDGQAIAVNSEQPGTELPAHYWVAARHRAVGACPRDGGCYDRNLAWSFSWRNGRAAHPSRQLRRERAAPFAPSARPESATFEWTQTAPSTS